MNQPYVSYRCPMCSEYFFGSIHKYKVRNSEEEWVICPICGNDAPFCTFVRKTMSDEFNDDSYVCVTSIDLTLPDVSPVGTPTISSNISPMVSPFASYAPTIVHNVSPIMSPREAVVNISNGMSPRSLLDISDMSGNINVNYDEFTDEDINGKLFNGCVVM